MIIADPCHELRGPLNTAATQTTAAFLIQTDHVMVVILLNILILRMSISNDPVVFHIHI